MFLRLASLLQAAACRRRTLQLIDEAKPGNGFIVGITEDVPSERRVRNCRAIMDGIDEASASGS